MVPRSMPTIIQGRHRGEIVVDRKGTQNRLTSQHDDSWNSAARPSGSFKQPTGSGLAWGLEFRDRAEAGWVVDERQPERDEPTQRIRILPPRPGDRLNGNPTPH